MSYYNYDENDIAKTLRKAMAQGASYDDVHRLLQARNRKIDSGGPEMEQYKNDALTQEANAYLSAKINKPSLDVAGMQQAREQVAAENFRAAADAHDYNYKSGVRLAKAQADAEEKEVAAAYRRSALADGERLAAVGLERGSADAPTSGYGETARTAAFLDYQNALGAVRDKEYSQVAELKKQYVNNMAESRQSYHKDRSGIAEDAAHMTAEQFNKDRDFHLQESEHNTQVNQWHQSYDDAQVQNTAQLGFDNALALFKQTGVVTDETMAQALGLPVGTKANAFNLAMEAFKQAGVVTDEAMAAALGLPVGTKTMARIEYEGQNELEWAEFDRAGTWHAEDNAYRNRVLSARGSAKSDSSFDDAFSLFKAVGMVITDDMAKTLGLPKGTKYWEYAQKQQMTDFETGIF